MNIQKKGFNFYVIEDLINGYLRHKVYMGYSKREAIKLFKKESLK